MISKFKLRQYYKDKIANELYKINQCKSNIRFYESKLKELEKKK